MATYFVTGTNRGIGLELVRQLAARSDVARVYATQRDAPSKELAAICESKDGAKVERLACDVTDPASLDSALSLVRTQLDKDGGGLDVLINNVGTQSAFVSGLEALADEDLTRLFDINVLAAHRVSKALLPLLKKGKGKKIVNLSSTLGSIGIATQFAPIPSPAYKITKAALNMLTVQYALELGKEGFTVLALSPGNIQTETGGGDGADLTPEVGVKATLDVILNAKPEDNGKFMNIHVAGWETAPGMNQYDGKEVPW